MNAYQADIQHFKQVEDQQALLQCDLEKIKRREQELLADASRARTKSSADLEQALRRAENAEQENLVLRGGAAAAGVDPQLMELRRRELEVDKQRLEGEVCSLKGDVLDLRQKLEAEQREVMSLQVEARRGREAVEKLGRIDVLEDEVFRLKAELRAVESAGEANKSGHGDHAKKVSAEVMTYKKEAEAALGQAASTRKELEHVQSELKRRNLEIARRKEQDAKEESLKKAASDADKKCKEALKKALTDSTRKSEELAALRRAMAETNKKTEELTTLRKAVAENSKKADEVAALKKTTAEASRKCDEMVKELAELDELKKSLAEKTKRVDELTREKNNFEANKKLFHREIDRLKWNLQKEQDARKADSQKATIVLEKSRQEAQRAPAAAAKAQEEGNKAAKRRKTGKKLLQKASKGLALAKSYKHAFALLRKRQNRPRETKLKRRSRVKLTPALQVVRKASVASSVATTGKGKRKEAPTGAACSDKKGGTGGGEGQQAKYSRGADVASAITQSLTNLAAKSTGYGYGGSGAGSGTGSSTSSAKTSGGSAAAAKIAGGTGKAVVTPPGTHSISKSKAVTKRSEDAPLLVDLEAEG
eukprot:TRINITY_DN13193_c0_g1_i2.p1 TRINITY_DN13193_c0_g1~~TRINITY_DN13193_c0_g1_i2.p1  ORF type:complete len:594 (+),score=165.97 TRINITY_DN13193_c0_g1_i2:524-2305(+)